MKRAVSLTCLALLLVVGAARAQAGRSTIAILGLEVIDPNGAPTQADVQTAKELTNDLRDRAKTGSGLTLAPNSDKELIDEKMIKSCDSEALPCMLDIGKDVGGEFLLYGRLTKKSNTYQVSLTLLDVAKGQAKRSLPNFPVPLNTTGPELLERAKQMYANVTGERTTATLVVKLNNGDHGTILLDRAEKGTITNGTGQVANVDEGKHKLRVEAEGYHPVEQDVTVGGGETKTVTVTLEKKEVTGTVAVTNTPSQTPSTGGGSQEVTTTRGSTAWKVVMGGAIVLAGGAAVYGFHAEDRVKSWQNFECSHGDYAGVSGGPPSSCSLPQTHSQDSQATISAYNKSGNNWATAANTSAGIAIAGGALALVALYEGFIATHEASSTSSEHAERGHRAHRERFVVTPVMSPDGGGATLRIDW